MPDEPRREELGPFQFGLLVLSLSLLAALAAELVLRVPPEVSRLIRFIDTVVCVIFLADFIQRLRQAPSKWEFMRWGWIDLLASVPQVAALRWGRIFRVVRIVRLLLRVRSMGGLLELLLASKARAGIASIVTLAFLIVAFSSIGVLIAEAEGRGNIKTAGDALWWSLATVTTVGYGDFYPVTTAGRVVAGFTMVAGVGMFGAMSAVVATILIGPTTKNEETLLTEVRALRAEVAQLRGLNPSSSASPPLREPVSARDSG